MPKWIIDQLYANHNLISFDAKLLPIIISHHQKFAPSKTLASLRAYKLVDTTGQTFYSSIIISLPISCQMVHQYPWIHQLPYTSTWMIPSFNTFISCPNLMTYIWQWEKGENCRAQYNKKTIDSWTKECPLVATMIMHKLHLSLFHSCPLLPQ